ncbi:MULTISPECIES: photosynthesis system II assembly factor Ycf48 [unclassified Microcoleus]|uniref:photosynthesis system II assembly factor Ycf48 n=1 Tax=unclassified Microcoleus TaxID=2642155 RepID=UPI002FD2C852
MVCSKTIVRFWQRIVMLLAAALICTSCSTIGSVSYNPWQVISLPTEANLQDIAFTGNPQHGWVVGSEATLLETLDGGTSWKPIALDIDDPRSRFASVSFSGSEGWIVGQPSVLLHTNDEGKSWTRIALSSQLPGSPSTIAALGPNSAEMTTDVGAIYRTSDGGKNWKAVVQDSFGVVRNINRSEDGQYVAVSSKGNFYSVWKPGQQAWEPHNRNSSRRLQNMGFTKDGRLWMLARGGQIQFSDPSNPDGWGKPFFPDRKASWGLLDMAYRTDNEVWVAGGGGNLLCSLDGGKTWLKDREVEDVPANFYRIVFMGPDRGFVIGASGTLLKYQGSAQAA